MIPYHKEYYAKNKELLKQKYRERWVNDRVDCLEHYGGICACCKENRYEFLALDHINGGGNKQRKIIGGSLVRWLKKNKYPTGFRILCHNCNHSLGMYGYCPHKHE